MKNEIFKEDAKSIVDLAFETKLFKEEVTRDDMNNFEEFIEFLLTSKFESYKRANNLLEKLKKNETK